MISDLQDLRQFWSNKYDNVEIVLWEGNEKYYGRMAFKDLAADLCADTIGGLMDQGELFLRKTR